jgi:hypothetical protein
MAGTDTEGETGTWAKCCCRLQRAVFGHVFKVFTRAIVDMGE